MATFNNLRAFLRSVGVSELEINQVPDTIELNQLADTIQGAPMVDYMRANYDRIFRLFGNKIAERLLTDPNLPQGTDPDIIPPRPSEQGATTKKATPFKVGDIESSEIRSSWIIAGNFIKNPSGKTGTLFLHLNRRRVYHWYAYPYVPESLWKLISTQNHAGTLFWTYYLHPNGYKPWGKSISNSGDIKQAVGKTGQNRGTFSPNQRLKLSKATRWVSPQSKNSGRIARKTTTAWKKAKGGN